MKFGIQLFGLLRDKPQLKEELKLLKDLGYREVEPCVSPERIEGFDHVIIPLEKFAYFAKEVAAFGLEMHSCHFMGGNIAAHKETLKKLSKEYGIEQFVVKSPRELTEESLQQTALTYMQVADALKEVGAALLIHNEAAEIKTKINGKTAYEYLLDLCMGKVGAQVDVGWVYHGGEDPEALLWRSAQYVKSLHYKDYKTVDGALTECVVGTGEVDTAACFQFGRAWGVSHYIDMDGFTKEKEQELSTCIKTLGSLGHYRENSVSYLNTLDVETGEVRVLKKYDKVIEAPNWLKKENRLIFNSEGRIWSYDIDTGEEKMIESGECDNCNNDHVVSEDENYIAVSHSAKGFSSQIYILPIDGGEPRLVTPNSPSFLHGWSPDMKELAYCAFRNVDGKHEVDIYTIPAEGGEEKRITGGGFNDGPEYSPDGEYIWFNSTRTGLMQIWRMKKDGSEQTQMTFNERNNWFGHVSPDGKKVAYLSYKKGELDAGDHLPNMRVELWLMNSDGSDPHPILSLFGGQGSINVNSWSKDNRHIAFVSYEVKHK